MALGRVWLGFWHWLHGTHNAEALLAIFTILLMAVTAGLWFHTRTIAIDAKNSSERQAKLAREEFSATHRPWVSVEVSIGSGLEWTPEGDARVVLVFDMTNTGGEPALHVEPSCEIYLPFGPTDPVQRQLSFSSQERRRVSSAYHGFTIFPGGRIGTSINMPISAASLKETEEWHVAMHGEAGMSLGFSATIVGCVVYRSVFDNAQHQTGFIYELSRANPDTPHLNFAIFKKDGDLSISQLRLTYSYLGSGVTD